MKIEKILKNAISLLFIFFIFLALVFSDFGITPSGLLNPLFLASLFIIITIFILIYIYSRAGAFYETLGKKNEYAFKRIFNLSKDLICKTGSDLIITDINFPVKHLLGYNPNEIIGKSIHALLMDDAYQELIKIIQTAKDEIPVIFDGKSQRKDNKIIWIKWSVNISWKDGSIFLIGKDITTSKKKEEIIRLKNSQLELARIISDYENIKNELLVQRENFIIRSLLQSIAGYLEIVMDETSYLKNELKDFLKLSHEGTEQILFSLEHTIKGNFLRSANVSFSLNIEPINDVNIHLEDEMKKIIKESSINLETDLNETEGLFIFGNAIRIAEALVIFINEARKVRKDVDFFLKSISKPYLNEVNLNLICKNMKSWPDAFEKDGLLPGDEIDYYSFEKEELPIFVAKSLVNIMNGLILFTFSPDKDLVISFRFRSTKEN